MAKSKTTTEKRITIEEQIKQLESQRKQLIQKEKAESDKLKTNRLCRHGEILETLLPDILLLTDEQFKAFLEATLLTDFARRKLDELVKISTEKEEIIIEKESEEKSI